MSTLRDAAADLGIPLSDEQLSLFHAYFELLVEWNRRVNLTRITDPQQVAIQHFLDSLTCLLVLPRPIPLRGLRLIDVGSGAGFPGLPLKIVRPELRLTLAESAGKKTAFLRQVVVTLGLQEVQVITARAEDLAHDPAHRECYDVAVSRAVAGLATLAEYCLPFLRLGGRMIAAKTAGIADELRAALPAFATLGGELVEARTVALPGLRVPRLLAVVDKTAPTPAQYPRKAGLPAKHPLTGP